MGPHDSSSLPAGQPLDGWVCAASDQHCVATLIVPVTLYTK